MLPAFLLPSSPSPAPLLQFSPHSANLLSSTLLLLLLLLPLPTIHSCRTSCTTVVSQGVDLIDYQLLADKGDVQAQVTTTAAST